MECQGVRLGLGDIAVDVDRDVADHVHRLFEPWQTGLDVVDEPVDAALIATVIIGGVWVIARPDQFVVATVDPTTVSIQHVANLVLVTGRAVTS